MARNHDSSNSSPPSRPTVALSHRSSGENLFSGALGVSPGPMTLVSSFFSENDPESDFRSFSQLLAGAMASPAEEEKRRRFSADELELEGESNSGNCEESEFRFNSSSRPSSLLVSQPSVFTVPVGLSPAALMDSPAFFSASQGPLGMSHQQILTQVPTQSVQNHSHGHIQNEYSSLYATTAPSLSQFSSLRSNTATRQKTPPLISDSKISRNESPEMSHSDQRSQPSSITIDKPVNDGFNWRKYGQKQVKGSEYPRSYYKCTHLNCPVKKKVERSVDGQVTEIIYKGQHNHQPPQPSKRAKDTGNSNDNSSFQGSPELSLQAHNMKRAKPESSQATNEHLSGSSDSEEAGDAETRGDARDGDEPDPKRRNMEAMVPEQAASHKTVTEPRIIVQTTSEVDLLDDGYRWRKYGQKVVKGNPYPRSYYKCTFAGCNVRKHVERASTDPKAVITTYEGKHNHDVPTARNSSHNTANSNASQLKTENVGPGKRAFGLLQLKEEFPT